jgi:hypothetical protein
MPSYTITAVQPEPRAWNSTKGGPMLSYRVTLRNEQGAEKPNVEWARKATSPAPAVGQTIEGTVEDGQYGPKFKAAQQMGGGGGGGGRPRDPAERRSIAMQASQKVAVDAVRACLDSGLWKPEDPTRVIAAAIIAVADKLYLRVMDAEADNVKHS